MVRTGWCFSRENEGLGKDQGPLQKVDIRDEPIGLRKPAYSSDNKILIEIKKKKKSLLAGGRYIMHGLSQ